MPLFLRKQGVVDMRRGVIDMGTNSMRLAIADVAEDGITMVYNEVAETRLGENMGTSEIIQPEPMERNIFQLKEFLAKMMKRRAVCKMLIL
mgnify:CR=1 FL=1